VRSVFMPIGTHGHCRPNRKMSCEQTLFAPQRSLRDIFTGS
jgi:hypothetical protein